MGIQDLQVYIQNAVTGGCVSVDLLRIAKNKKPQAHRNKLRLVLDAESCLDRLYGGFFSDWASGGQWNRMISFLSILCHNMAQSGIELVVFFNGALEKNRLAQWSAQQQQTRRNVASVMRHLQGKGTPPPKVWWVAPVCLRNCLRMALRHLQLTVLCSVEDHKQEIIAYCRENAFHGILVEDPEYLAFDPPRYFSSINLKLTYKGSLETKEYLVNRIAESLQLPLNRLPILGALLGTHLLGEDQLVAFYQRVCPTFAPGKPISENVIKGVADFVRGLGPAADDVDAVIGQVFPDGSKESANAAKLKTAIQYYISGTKDGYFSFKARTSYRSRHHKVKGKTGKTDNKQESPETHKFASETTESEEASLAAFKEATANSTPLGPEIVVEPPGPMVETTAPEVHPEESITNGVTNGVSGLQLSTSSSSSNSSAASPSHAPLNPSSTQSQPQCKLAVEENDESRMVGLVSGEVLRTAYERHHKGLMAPGIYQILALGEIKLPAVLEDESYREFPSCHQFYKPVRQMVYGILFNLHHLTFIQTHPNKAPGADAEQQNNGASSSTTPSKFQHPTPDPQSIYVKEWVWSKTNQYCKPEIVKPEKVGWGVPTVQRLWFGSIHSSTIDDKRRRLRAFLSCMRSDTPLMLDPKYVPQQMLIFACVIRYMMSSPDVHVLRKHELDALIAQAHSPLLMKANLLQDLQLTRLNTRGVQLGTLVMAGVENAILANDACGAPIPWLMCSPCLFFDGKLFQHTLIRAETSKNLMELCDHQLDQVMKVERMRAAVLEGIDPQFSRMQLMSLTGPQVGSMRGAAGHPGIAPMSVIPAGALIPPMRSGRTGTPRSQRQVLARGGQLEVAGVVVGQWGANYGSGIGVGGRASGVNRAPGIQQGYQGSKMSYGGMAAGMPPGIVYGTGNRSRGGGGGAVSKSRLPTRGRGGMSGRRSNVRGGGKKNSPQSRGSTANANGTTMSTCDSVSKSPSNTAKLHEVTTAGSSGKTDIMAAIGQFEDISQPPNAGNTIVQQQQQQQQHSQTPSPSKRSSSLTSQLAASSAQ